MFPFLTRPLAVLTLLSTRNRPSIPAVGYFYIGIDLKTLYVFALDSISKSAIDTTVGRFYTSSDSKTAIETAVGRILSCFHLQAGQRCGCIKKATASRRRLFNCLVHRLNALVTFVPFRWMCSDCHLIPIACEFQPKLD